MIGIEIDFTKYVAKRLGTIEQRARDGAAYAFSGEAKTRRTLTSAKPVTIAIEGTSRLWKNKAKKEIQSQGEQVRDQNYPKLFRAMEHATRALSLSSSPSLYVLDGVERGAHALGTHDDELIVIDKSLANQLNDEELTALLARELGHLQNNHTLFVTCLHYLEKDAVFFVRWIVQPALLALKAWSRRAEITCDRAALLAVRKMSVFISMELKIMGESHPNADAYLAELPTDGSANVAEIFRSHPTLPTRIAALKAFAASRYYRKICGEEAGDAPDASHVDAEVTEILSAF